MEISWLRNWLPVRLVTIIYGDANKKTVKFLKSDFY